jgi:hypothetical protein
MPFAFIAFKTLNSLAFQTFDFEYANYYTTDAVNLIFGMKPDKNVHISANPVELLKWNIHIKIV